MIMMATKMAIGAILLIIIPLIILFLAIFPRSRGRCLGRHQFRFFPLLLVPVIISALIIILSRAHIMRNSVSRHVIPPFESCERVPGNTLPPPMSPEPPASVLERERPMPVQSPPLPGPPNPGRQTYSPAGTPAIWQKDIEQQFQANAYTSMKAAAKALGRQLPDLFALVSAAKSSPPEIVQIYGQTDANMSSEVIQAVADGLHSQESGIRIFVETVVPGHTLLDTRSLNTSSGANPTLDKANASASTQKRIAVVQLLFKIQHLQTLSGQGRFLDLYTRSGTLIMNVRGTGGEITRTADFVEKPWITDWTGFINNRPGENWIIARSQQGCTSEQEAHRQALDQACALLSNIVSRIPGRYLPGRRDKIAPVITPNDLERNGLIVDRYVQTLEGMGGPIWREALLINASSLQTSPMVRQINEQNIAQARYQRHKWTRNLLSCSILMALVFVLYIFINLATRGYYTWSLRILAALLTIVGLFFIFVIA